MPFILFYFFPPKKKEVNDFTSSITSSNQFVFFLFARDLILLWETSNILIKSLAVFCQISVLVVSGLVDLHKMTPSCYFLFWLCSRCWHCGVCYFLVLTNNIYQNRIGYPYQSVRLDHCQSKNRLYIHTFVYII